MRYLSIAFVLIATACAGPLAGDVVRMRVGERVLILEVIEVQPNEWDVRVGYFGRVLDTERDLREKKLAAQAAVLPRCRPFELPELIGVYRYGPDLVETLRFRCIVTRSGYQI